MWCEMGGGTEPAGTRVWAKLGMGRSKGQVKWFNSGGGQGEEDFCWG